MIAGLRKLRGRSFRELTVRARQSLSSRWERMRFEAGSRPEWLPFKHDIASRLSSGDAHLFASLRGGPGHMRRVAEEIFAHDPAWLPAIRAEVDALLCGRMSLLGLGEMEVGDPPNWHREARSGCQVPRVHWSRIPIFDTAVIGDHKILWEVSRHQYLFKPALCWLVEGQERHFDVVQRHLASWLDENQPQSGAHWTSSLEVAYRAITWCWLLWLLRDAPWNKTLISRIAGALEYHALHVERYLSTYFSPNTHLTGEALGLFYVGTFLPESRHASRWRTTGAEILESWMRRQVHGDGVYFEQATQYHRYTAEIYLHYLQLATSTGWPVADHVRSTLSRLFDVLLSISFGDGQMPLVGDDDGGLLLPLDCYPPQQLNGVLLAGAAALDRPELAVHGARNPALSYWLCGASATERLRAGQTISPPDWRDMHFASGGVAVIRDGWTAGDAVAVIDAGPHGAMNCGHAHADALSCTVSLAGKPFIIDRGTLTYMGGERNSYRSTESHNTLEFDHESSVEPRGRFHWSVIPPRPVARLRCNERVAVFEGVATGHLHARNASLHQRTIAHVRGGAWLIYDRGTRESCQGACIRWQFSPELMTTESAPGVFDVFGPDRVPVARMLVPLCKYSGLSQRDVSLQFGHSAPAFLLEAGVATDLRALSMVLPVTDSRQFSSVLPLQLADSQGWTWSDSSGTHRVLLDSAIPEVLPGLEGQANLLWLIDSRPPSPHSHFEPDFLLVFEERGVQHGAPRNCITEQPIAGSASGCAVILRRNEGRWDMFPAREPSRGRE